MTTRSGRWRRRLALAAGLVLLGALALWLAAAPLLSVLIERGLRDAGFARVAVGPVALRPGGIAVERIALGDAVTLDNLQADIDFPDILQGRLSRLGIGRVTASLTVSDDGLVIPEYTPEPSAGDGGGLPVDRISIDDAAIDIATPAGELTAILTDMRLDADGRTLQVAGAGQLATPYGRLDAEAEGSMDPAEDTRLTLTITGGRLAAFGAEAVELAGDAQLAMPRNGAMGAALDLRAGTARLADTSLGALTLAATYADGQVEAVLTSAAEAPARIDFTGQADLAAAQGRMVQLSGRAAFLPDSGAAGEVHLDGTLALPDDEQPAALDGEIVLTTAQLRLPGYVADGSLSLDAAVTGDGQTARLTLNALSGGVTPAASLLPEGLAAYAGVPTQFTARGRDKPLVAHIDLSAGRLAVPAIIALETAEAGLEAAANFEIATGPSGMQVTAEDLALTTRNLQWADIRVADAVLTGAGAFSGASDWRLSGKGTATVSGMAGAVRYTDLEIDWSGSLRASAGSIALHLDDCLSGAIGALAMGGAAFRDVSLPCLTAPDGEPLLSMEPETGLRRFAVQGAAAPLSATLAAGETRMLAGTWPAFSFFGVADAEGFRKLDARMEGGALRSEVDGVGLDGIEGQVAFDADTPLAAEAHIAAVESLRTPALWVPLTVDATAEETDAGVDFMATASDNRGLFVFDAAGQSGDGNGRADLTLYPIHFIAGATEIGDLSPFLADAVTAVSGGLSFEGSVDWGVGGLTSGGTLTLSNLGAASSGIRVTGIETAMRLGSLLPPATAGPQQVTVKTVKAGVPLTDGEITIAYRSDGPARIGPVTFNMAGGRLTAEPFILDLGAGGDTRVVLEAENVDLERMIAESGIGGLTGSGTLAGRLPLVLSPDSFRVDDGTLRAVSEGELRYTPAELPAFLQGDDMRARMLREVLQNFQYTNLSLHLTGGAGAGTRQQVELTANGSNPDFLDGHPVELSFDFEGSLLSALSSAVNVTGASGLQRLYEQQERQESE